MAGISLAGSSLMGEFFLFILPWEKGLKLIVKFGSEIYLFLIYFTAVFFYLWFETCMSFEGEN